MGRTRNIIFCFAGQLFTYRHKREGERERENQGGKIVLKTAWGEIKASDEG